MDDYWFNELGCSPSYDSLPRLRLAEPKQEIKRKESPEVQWVQAASAYTEKIIIHNEQNPAYNRNMNSGANECVVPTFFQGIVPLY